ncbi:unnamed protein product, partial [Phaeothamnion confervicola]
MARRLSSLTATIRYTAAEDEDDGAPRGNGLAVGGACRRNCSLFCSSPAGAAQQTQAFVSHFSIKQFPRRRRRGFNGLRWKRHKQAQESLALARDEGVGVDWNPLSRLEKERQERLGRRDDDNNHHHRRRRPAAAAAAAAVAAGGARGRRGFNGD